MRVRWTLRDILGRTLLVKRGGVVFEPVAILLPLRCNTCIAWILGLPALIKIGGIVSASAAVLAAGAAVRFTFSTRDARR